MLEGISKESSLSLLTSQLLAVWPEHEKFLRKSFEKRDSDLLETSHEVADKILRIVGPRLKEYLASYRWTCEMLTEEELFFRRENRYRYSKLSDAIGKVYGVDNFMTPYVQGLLLTQVLWENHIRAIHSYRHYLTETNGTRHLEIGPGHGLLLFFATLSNPQKIAAWDISESSLNETKKCLEKLSAQSQIQYQQINVSSPNALAVCKEKFDTIVLSEILEHTENPREILENLKQILSDRGKIYINVPSNCPAPDHIYYFSGEPDVVSMVRDAGLKIRQIRSFPMTGYSLEAAKKRRATISHIVIASLTDSVQ